MWSYLLRLVSDATNRAEAIQQVSDWLMMLLEEGAEYRGMFHIVNKVLLGWLPFLHGNKSGLDGEA